MVTLWGVLKFVVGMSCGLSAIMTGLIGVVYAIRVLNEWLFVIPATADEMMDEGKEVALAFGGGLLVTCLGVVSCAWAIGLPVGW